MMGSSGRLPPLTDRATKRKPKEGPSDLCVFHMARRSNDERAGRARDELLISLTRPRGGVFWTQPLLRQADGADLVVRQARAWKFVQVGCRMMQSAPPRIVTGPRCRARSLEGLAHHQQTPERSRANARPADRTTLRRAFRHFKTNEKKRKRSRLQERSEGSRRKQSDHHPSF
jgi:hypothetical protein